MTNEQINTAIGTHLHMSRDFPHFAGDLNEMHRAERVLSEEQWSVYLEHLPRGWIGAVHATARERAIAFLGVFGKWEGAE